jgi:hypothetical protein
VSEPHPDHRSDSTATWWVETPAIAAIDFGLARGFSDFDGAFRLLHDQYVWRRYMRPNPAGRRLSLHNVLPTTKVFVARAEARVVGTLSAVEDSRLGLPMDEAFGPELGRLRERGRRLVEAASLALDPVVRASGIAILVRLLRLVVLYAARIVRASDLCFVVHRRHRAFYLRLFPFRRFSETRPYPRINGAPVIGLRLDLGLVRALIRSERAGLSPGPHASFLCGPQGYEQVMPRLRRDLPKSGLTPAEWARLFAGAGPPESGRPQEPGGAGPQEADLSTVQLAALAGAVHPNPGGQS